MCIIIAESMNRKMADSVMRDVQLFLPGAGAPDVAPVSFNHVTKSLIFSSPSSLNPLKSVIYDTLSPVNSVMNTISIINRFHTG